MLKKTFALLKDTGNEWLADRCARIGAALSCYSIFAIAPLLVISVAIAGFVFGEDAARGKIAEEIGGTIGEPAAKTIQDMVHAAASPAGSTLATITGIAILLLAASGLFIELQDALNSIWKVTTKPGRTLWNIVRERILSFTVVVATGFLLLVSLIASAALSALTDWLTPESLLGGAALWQAMNFVVSLAVITLLFALIFKVLPDVRLAWRDVWIGAAVTAFLFSVGKYLIGLYLGQTSTASAYGAAGSLVIVLIWVYYSAQIMLFGVEFTRVYTRWRGVQVQPRDNAMFVTSYDERVHQDRATVEGAAGASAPARRPAGPPLRRPA